MKKLIFASILSLASFVGFAQEKPLTFGIGVEAAMPLGDWKDVQGFGIGGTLQGNYWLDESLALTLNSGYKHYSGKDYTVLGQTFEGPSLGVIPILGGIEYNFTDQIFASAQLGVSMFKAKGADEGTSAFTYAPGIGIRFGNASLLLKYTGYSKDNVTNNDLGARLAFNF